MSQLKLKTHNNRHSRCLVSPCWLVFIVFISACQTVQTPLPPLPTQTALPATPSPTPTIIWFPPTATPTMFPTPLITPTQDIRPQSGEIILSDDFSEPSGWTLGRTTSASIALGQSELTLALNQPGGYLFSLRREPSLDDFFLEITASPSICRGRDEYGLLLRVSPSLDFYRFSLSCDGQLRLDKYYLGKASSPHPWSISGEVPPGAPSSSRLGVWAAGQELRFYVQDQLQFSLRDPSLTAGQIGVFIRSAGENAITVSFTDLIIRQVEP